MERWVALLREHERLLKAIAAKKKATAALAARIEEAQRKFAAAQPLVEQCRRLDEEIHVLFAELLARKRQPRETRHLLTAVYQLLQNAGVLRRRDPWDDLDDEAPGDVPHVGDRPVGTAPGEGRAPPAGAGGYSARRPTDDSAGQSVRGLFRDLATALHPDKVHDEAEKARRTEVMKEISRAYEEGDLARLLELKRKWMSGAEIAAASDDPEHRCAKVERMNLVLRGQLRALNEEARELRRSPPARLLRDLRHAAATSGQDPIAAMIAETQEEMERLRELRDLVASFRDGKITIDELARGPRPMSDTEPFPDLDADFASEDFEIVFDGIVAELMGGATDASAGGKKRRRRRANRGGRR